MDIRQVQLPLLFQGGVNGECGWGGAIVPPLQQKDSMAIRALESAFLLRLEFAPAQTGEFVYRVEIHYFLPKLKCAPRVLSALANAAARPTCRTVAQACGSRTRPDPWQWKPGSHRRHLRLRLQQRGGENFEETSKRAGLGRVGVVR